MEVKVDAKNDKYWIVTLIGEDHTLANLIAERLLKDPDVEFAAYVLEHPLVASPKLIVRTKKGDAYDALKKAIDKVSGEVSDFKAKVKKIREKK